MARYFLVILGLYLHAQSLWAQCDIRPYLNDSSYINELELLSNSQECVGSWASEFLDATEENEKTLLLQLIIHPGGTSYERQNLIDALVQNPSQLTPAQLSIVDFYQMTRGIDLDIHFQRFIDCYSPLDQRRALLDFPFAWYEFRSAKFLQILLQKYDEIDADLVHIVLRSFSQNFPRAADEIIARRILDLYAAAMSSGDPAGEEAISGLIGFMTSEKRLEIVDTVLTDIPYDLDAMDSYRVMIVADALAGNSADISADLQKKIENFYFNPFTAPQANESDENFASRRSKLLSMAMILKSALAAGNESFAKNFLAANLEPIFASDLAELTVSARILVTKLPNRVQIASQLINSSEYVLVLEGTRLLRKINSSEWYSQQAGQNGITNRLQMLARYTQDSTANREMVRHEAAAILAMAQQSVAGRNWSGVLSGFSSSDPEVRLNVLNTLPESAIDDSMVVDQLVEVLRRDPDMKVRAAAISTILHLFESEEQEIKDPVLWESLALGVSLLATAKDLNDPEASDEIEELLKLYFKRSPHAWQVIQQGLASGEARIHKLATMGLDTYVSRLSSEFGQLTYRLFKLADTEPSTQAVQSELPMVWYKTAAAILKEYEGEQTKPGTRVDRIMAMQETMVAYINTLKIVAANGNLSPEEKEHIDAMILQLKELLDDTLR